MRLLTAWLESAAHGQQAFRIAVDVGLGQGEPVRLHGIRRVGDVAGVVHHEIERQKALNEIATDLLGRNLPWDRLVAKDVTRLVGGLKKASDHRVRALLLPGFRGVMRHGLGPARRVIDEFVDRARVAGCLQSDMVLCSEGEEGFVLAAEFERAGQAMGARRSDVVFLVVGRDEDLDRAVEALVIRARQAAQGVPGEIRRVLPEGESEFLRVLDPAEAYPESELGPVSTKGLDGTMELPWDVFAELVDLGMSETQAGVLIHRRMHGLVRRIVDMGVAPRTAAHLVMSHGTRKTELVAAVAAARPVARAPRDLIRLVNTGRRDVR